MKETKKGKSQQEKEPKGERERLIEVERAERKIGRMLSREHENKNSDRDGGKWQRASNCGNVSGTACVSY